MASRSFNHPSVYGEAINEIRAVRFSSAVGGR